MDRYDEAIAYLAAHPEEIDQAEEFPGDNKVAGCLFVNAASNLYSYLKMPNGKWLGNPLRIKERPDHFTAQEEIVTKQILADKRLPNKFKDCRLEHLPVLAQYQRKFDRFWNRKFRTTPSEGRESPVQTQAVKGERLSIKGNIIHGQLKFVPIVPGSLIISVVLPDQTLVLQVQLAETTINANYETGDVGLTADSQLPEGALASADYMQIVGDITESDNAEDNGQGTPQLDAEISGGEDDSQGEPEGDNGESPAVIEEGDQTQNTEG